MLVQQHGNNTAKRRYCSRPRKDHRFWPRPSEEKRVDIAKRNEMIWNDPMLMKRKNKKRV
jgi:hypothetical protein